MANNNTTVAALDQTLIIRPRISLWTGRGTFDRKDLGPDADKLPPKTLTTDGSITLCDRKTIVQLESLRTAVDRDFGKFCVAFMDGFATDYANMDKALGVMNDHRPKFDELRKELLDGFEANTRGWMADNPKYAHLVEKHLPTKEYVASRVQYRAFMFRAVMASEAGADAPENAGLVNEAAGLSGQLFDEIEKEARQFRERSLTGRNNVTQDAVRPVRRLREKLQALIYLDVRIGPVISHIDASLDALPKTGRMEGGDLSSLLGIVDFLADAERMKRHGAGIIAGSASTKDVMDVLGAPADNGHEEPKGSMAPIVTADATAESGEDLFSVQNEDLRTEEVVEDDASEDFVPPQPESEPDWCSGGITF